MFNNRVIVKAKVRRERLHRGSVRGKREGKRWRDIHVDNKEEKNECEVLLGASELKKFGLCFCWNVHERQEEKTWSGPPFEPRKIFQRKIYVRRKIDKKKLAFLSRVR